MPRPTAADAFCSWVTWACAVCTTAARPGRYMQAKLLPCWHITEVALYSAWAVERFCNEAWLAQPANIDVAARAEMRRRMANGPFAAVIAECQTLRKRNLAHTSKGVGGEWERR